MAKRSGRAVNEGLDGRSERPASGQGHPRAAAERRCRKTARTSGRCRSRLPFFQRISPPSGGRAIQGLNASAAAARSNKFSDKSLDRRDPLAGSRLLELPDDG